MWKCQNAKKHVMHGSSYYPIRSSIALDPYAPTKAARSVMHEDPKLGPAECSCQQCLVIIWRLTCITDQERYRMVWLHHSHRDEIVHRFVYLQLDCEAEQKVKGKHRTQWLRLSLCDCELEKRKRHYQVAAILIPSKGILPKALRPSIGTLRARTWAKVSCVVQYVRYQRCWTKECKRCRAWRQR